MSHERSRDLVVVTAEPFNAETRLDQQLRLITPALRPLCRPSRDRARDREAQGIANRLSCASASIEPPPFAASTSSSAKWSRVSAWSS